MHRLCKPKISVLILHTASARAQARAQARQLYALLPVNLDIRTCTFNLINLFLSNLSKFVTHTFILGADPIKLFKYFFINKPYIYIGRRSNKII